MDLIWANGGQTMKEDEETLCLVWGFTLLTEKEMAALVCFWSSSGSGQIENEHYLTPQPTQRFQDQRLCEFLFIPEFINVQLCPLHDLNVNNSTL